jgi:hypothetical protein
MNQVHDWIDSARSGEKMEGHATKFKSGLIRYQSTGIGHFHTQDAYNVRFVALA